MSLFRRFTSRSDLKLITYLCVMFLLLLATTFYLDKSREIHLNVTRATTR